jgi:hypothetical protein
MLIQGDLCTALGQALICVTGRDPFRAGGLLVCRWSKHESITTVDCATVSLVTLLITLSLLICPMVFHVLINGCATFLKFIRSCDHVGDQSLGRSPNGFPWSHVNWSHDTREVEGSRDRSGDLAT